MERYWQNTWQYKRILEILDDYWITEKDETFVQIVMHFAKGDKEQHKTIAWFNPKLIPDIDADPDIPSLDEIPDSDLVNVIRCRECKHSVDYYNDGECYCRNPKYSDLIYISGGWNHYCGYSERREK